MPYHLEFEARVTEDVFKSTSFYLFAVVVACGKSFTSNWAEPSRMTSNLFPDRIATYFSEAAVKFIIFHCSLVRFTLQI